MTCHVVPNWRSYKTCVVRTGYKLGALGKKHILDTTVFMTLVMIIVTIPCSEAYDSFYMEAPSPHMWASSRKMSSIRLIIIEQIMHTICVCL